MLQTKGRKWDELRFLYYERDLVSHEQVIGKDVATAGAMVRKPASVVADDFCEWAVPLFPYMKKKNVKSKRYQGNNEKK